MPRFSLLFSPTVFKMLEIIPRLKARKYGLYSEFDGWLYMLRRVSFVIHYRPDAVVKIFM